MQSVSARWVRSLLLAAMAVAVVGMHHLAGPGAQSRHVHVDPAAHAVPIPADISGTGSTVHDCCAMPMVTHVGESGTDGHGPGHRPGHGLLHLCLAVLMAAAGLALMWIVTGRHWWQQVWAGTAAGIGVIAVARPPPVAMSRRLASLCVLRV